MDSLLNIKPNVLENFLAPKGSDKKNLNAFSVVETGKDNMPLTLCEYVNVAYKYQDQEKQEYLIKLNQALDFTKSMTTSILCTNQARYNRVIIHDVPKIIDPSSPQCMTFPEENVN